MLSRSIVARFIIVICHCIVAILPRVCFAYGYEATWESLDKREIPKWFGSGKVGIFIHWGVFSVPAFKSEWFWYNWQQGGAKHHQQEYIDFIDRTEKKGFAYSEYASRFDATFYEPDYWAEIFAQSGAQYVVLTSKHHEGFCNWDSREIGTTYMWNSMEKGPKRDLVGELAKAIRNPKVKSIQTNNQLKFGVYHSLLEWYNPLLKHDINNNMTSHVFTDTKTMPELYELVEKYKPEIIWSDGDWNANSEYWKSKEFLAWLATNSSVKDSVVWNDRWGTDSNCKHGSFLNCHDRYLPNRTNEHKWENAMTLDKNSWGWNRKAKISDYLTTKELIDEMVTTVARNGNILINVGPAADGTISPIFVDRLLGLGDWLKVNGQAIYNTQSWKICDQDLNDHTVYYTRDDTLLYAHLTQWPLDNQLHLHCPEASNNTRAFILGVQHADESDSDGIISVIEADHSHKDKDPTIPPVRILSSHSRQRKEEGVGGVTIQLPYMNPSQLPCQHVWVVAMTAIDNLDGNILTEYK